VNARLALACLCLLAVAPVAFAAGPPNAAELEAELVCPVCDTTLDQSTSPVAERMKLFIRERIAAGDTEQEIKDALVAQFGPGVLASTGGGGLGALAWIVPLVALLGGAIAVTVLVRGWSRRTAAEATATDAELEPGLDRRLDEELARYDA
jgi:cytochrome c-type biogenesis protein CcmH